MSMPAPTPGHEFSERIPSLLLEKDIFNQAFFQEIWREVKMLTQLEEVFVNSTAVVRHKLAEVFAGEDRKVAESRGDYELSYKDYLSKVDKPSLIEYSAEASISKFFREYDPTKTEELVVTADTINYVKIDGEWQRMEKPETLEEAKQQIDTLIEADYFIGANGTAMGYVGDNGYYGASVWLLPMKFEFESGEQKETVRKNIYKHLEYVFEDYKNRHKQLRPGGVSSTADVLMPYIHFGLFEKEEDHEMWGREIKDEGEYFDDMSERIRWYKGVVPGVRTLDKPDYFLAGMAATIIGSSPFGLMRAAKQFIGNIKRDIHTHEDENLQQCNNLREKLLEMIGMPKREAALL